MVDMYSLYRVHIRLRKCVQRGVFVMHFEYLQNRLRSRPRIQGNETATSAKVFFEHHILQSVSDSSWVKRESVLHGKPHPQPPYQALAWSYRYSYSAISLAVIWHTPIDLSIESL